MQRTERNPAPDLDQADLDPATPALDARRWLGRRLAWERRLGELEEPLRVPRLRAARARLRPVRAPGVPRAS